MESSSGEFTWEDVSTDRNNNNDIIFQKSKPAPLVQMDSDLVSEFKQVIKRDEDSSISL